MLRYILKRILVMIPTLILISMLVFTIIELPPGDYFESYVAELRAMGRPQTLPKSRSCASAMASTSRRRSVTSAGQPACWLAISVILSNISCR